jgi:N-acetylglucosaminyldiphosphoundecaprenol N-acetyl-beta-D-mannosaminyltransferase
MGSPNQENFLIELANEGWNGSGYTCGGFFHQTSKKGIQYYPTWCDKYNLRWMYRMYDEPKLIKRYVWHYPIFIFIFIFDMIVYKIGSDK